MKVFVAGASGAIGRHLIPTLVRAGHSVVAMTRPLGRIDAIRDMGAEPVVADALDREAVIEAVRAARPEVVVHQLTAIPANASFRTFDRDFALTNRLRREGLDHLLAGARAAGARRIIAQSYVGWNNARSGGPVKTEEDPLDPNPAPVFRETQDTIRYLEATLRGAEGIEGVAMRYGTLYGPGSGFSRTGYVLEQVRRRRLPIVGRGTGVWSFVHLEDVARATVAALDRGAPTVYNIVDDDPAPVSEWLPALAAAVGAKPPMHVPSFVGRLVGGEATVVVMNEIRGASNAKAKPELDWTLAYPTWRDGFRTGL